MRGFHGRSQRFRAPPSAADRSSAAVSGQRGPDRRQTDEDGGGHAATRYRSEAAFSRAFARVAEEPPSAARRALAAREDPAQWAATG